MRIAMDFNPVLRKRYSGFWTYGVNFLRALVAEDKVGSIALVYSRPLKSAGRAIDCWRHRKIHHVASRLRMSRWERWWRLCPRPQLQRLCGEFDVYHSFHHLMPPTTRRPRVLTVHDLRRHRLPEMYPSSDMRPFERAVAKADRIIAISHSTRDDLVGLLGVESDLIDVVHLGTPPGFEPSSAEGRRDTLAWLSQRFARTISGFAVVLASRDRRKNLPAALRAFGAATPRLDKDFCLLIVGKMPQDAEVSQAIASAPDAGRILLAGALHDHEYRGVLAGARMMLFLSLYEGFGLPLLEAMASGVPVIASNTSSIPEVVGDAGVLIAPADDGAIAAGIERLAGDDARHQELACAGLERAEQFTWQRNAQETLACYGKVLTAQGWSTA